MKKIVLATLLALAGEAAFAAAPASNVIYDVNFSRDGKVLKQETLTTKIGVPVASSIVVARDGTNCTFKDASGAPVAIQYSLNDATVITAVPSALKDGRVETIINATISQGSAKDAVKSGECSVTPGQSRSITVVDFVRMHQGDTRTYSLGDGTVMVLKLTKGGDEPASE